MVKNLEELRTMSKKDLSKAYDISGAKATSLFYALKTKYFPVITDSGLSIEQMAHCTGLDDDTVRNYRSALIKVGLEDRRDPGRASCLDVVSAIKGDPKTYERIAEVTGRKVKHVSSRVAYLKGDHTVLNVCFELGRTKSPVLKSQQVLGRLSRKSMVYLPGEEKLLGMNVAKEITKDLTSAEKRTLLAKLKRFLPKEAFDVVYYHVHRNDLWVARKHPNVC
jgi:hypothetical protein